MACDALSAARAAKRGIRLSITVRNAADLSAWHVVLTETTRIVLPGFDINTTLNAGSSTLQHLLEKVYAAISPSLSQIAVGAEMLQKFRQQYMFEGVAKGSSVESGEAELVVLESWIVVLEDVWGGLDLAECCKGTNVSGVSMADITVTSVPSAIDRLPYQLKTVTPDWLGSGMNVRLAEQVGRGIGSHTYSGALVLAMHLAKGFPEGHWKGKRVLEVGGGVGLLGLLVATLGAHVVNTDRPEYIELMRTNIAINAKVLAACGGSMVAEELEWGTTDHCKVNPDGTAFDYVIGADIVYPHEIGAKAAFSALIQTLRDFTKTRVTTAIIQHAKRDDCGRSFFKEAAPKHFLVDCIGAMAMPEHGTGGKEANAGAVQFEWENCIKVVNLPESFDPFPASAEAESDNAEFEQTGHESAAEFESHSSMLQRLTLTFDSYDGKVAQFAAEIQVGGGGDGGGGVGHDGGDGSGPLAMFDALKRKHSIFTFTIKE